MGRYWYNMNVDIGITWIIWRCLSNQESIHHHRWLRENVSYVHKLIILIVNSCER